MSELYYVRETDRRIEKFIYNEDVDNGMEALELLQTAAARIHPIMVKYDWNIYALQELYKSHRYVKSHHITRRRWFIKRRYLVVEVKVRRDDDPYYFRDIDDIVDDLLQQLCWLSKHEYPDPLRTLLPKVRSEYWYLMDNKHTGYVLTGDRVGFRGHIYLMRECSFREQTYVPLPPMDRSEKEYAARLRENIREVPSSRPHSRPNSRSRQQQSQQRRHPTTRTAGRLTQRSYRASQIQEEQSP